MTSNQFNTAAAPANDNARDPNAELQEAVDRGDIDQVKESLRLGANIDARDAGNDTPLIIAAREGFLDVVKLLIEQGADTSLVNNFGQTALMASLRAHQDEQINLALIAGKTPVNAPDHKGRTAAFFAAQDNLPVTMKALGDAGADFTLTGEDGVTPLIWATRLPGHHEVIAEITKFPCGIDAQDEDKRTALMEAVNTRDAKLVADYIALKANVMLRDKDQKSARDLAQESGFAEGVRLVGIAEAALYHPMTGGVTGGVSAPRTATFKPKTPAS